MDEQLDPMQQYSPAETLGNLHELAWSADSGIITGPRQLTPQAEGTGIISGAIDLIAQAPQLLATSVASGVVGLYNTGVAAANFLGADLEEGDTQAAIAAFMSLSE